MKNKELHKQYLRNRAAKNERRRSRYKKAIKKKNVGLERSKKVFHANPNYSHRDDELKLKAPLRFSLIESPDETLNFFESLSNLIFDRYKSQKNIFIDVSDIEYVTIDALMYLVGVLYSTSTKSYIHIRGSYPKKPEIRSYFVNSGFYKFVNSKYKNIESIGGNNIQIANGAKVDPLMAKKLSDFLASKAGIHHSHFGFIYDMMIELMSNTSRHAYTNKDSHSLKTQWYSFAEYDGESTISFTFLDIGAGIPGTVRKKFAEKIDFLHLKNEYSYVISALAGEFRTSTNLHNRGKGLPQIKEYCGDDKIQNVRIITNKADVLINRNDVSGYTLVSPLRGTLYYWNLDISKLKGAMENENKSF